MIDVNALRAAFRTSLPEGLDQHPADDVWERMACDELTDPERDNVLDHIIACPQCREIHRAILVVKERAHSFDPGAPKPPPRGTWWTRMVGGHRWVFPSAFAAAAVVVMVVVNPLNRAGLSPDSPVGDSAITRSHDSGADVRLLAPMGEVAGLPLSFSWQAPASVDGFVVELLDGEGEPLWTSPETVKTEVPWPSDLEAKAGRYYWRVHSYGRGSVGVSSSDLIVFDIVPGVTANPQ